MKRNLLLIIFLLLVPPLFATDLKVDAGVIDGSPYRIQIPENWNKGLVMYAHGYLLRDAAWRPMSPALSAVFLDRGFALAEAGYSRQGWALEEAPREIEALRRFFVEKYGDPKPVFIAGHSMGGIITMALIETYPKAYDGALPMSAPLMSALRFFKDPVFDQLVTFEALFGDALPESHKPLLEAETLSPKALQTALDADPDLAERFAQHWGVRPQDLASNLFFFHLIFRELMDRAGGNPIDNRNTVYTGFGSVTDLNAKVPRYAADAKAEEYLRRFYTATGRLQHPVLAVHTTYDACVPPRLAFCYNETTAITGCDRWFVQTFVDAEGHCNISPDLTGKAFDLLRNWAAEGVRPEPGLLK